MQKQSFLGAEHFVLQNVRKSLFGAEHFVEQNVQHQIDLAPKCSALHFVLQNVMPCKNAFGAKMHSVRCKNAFGALQKYIFAPNAFGAKMYFCNASILFYKMFSNALATH